MTTLVAIFGALISLIGVIGVVSPETLMGIVTSAWRSSRGIYIAVGIRLVMGIILVIAAPSCRFPAASTDGGSGSRPPADPRRGAAASAGRPVRSAAG
jgi:hypothetical protein